MAKPEDSSVDVSLDLLGTKPLAVAAEHASKAVVNGVGNFLSAICMPAAEEIGLALRDRVAKFRQKNLEAIVEKTQAKLQVDQAEPTGACSPVLIRQVIEEASWVDDPCVQDMWAGLLAAASVHDADDSIIYTDMLKRLSPFQARVLNHVYNDPRTYSAGPVPLLNSDADFSPREPLVYPAREILGLYPGDLARYVNIAHVTHHEILHYSENHSLAVGRFRPQLEGLVSLGLVRGAQIIPSVKERGSVLVHFQPTLKGLDLYMRGRGILMYPLEGFIVTQAHYFQRVGKGPFSRDLEGNERV